MPESPPKKTIKLPSQIDETTDFQNLVGTPKEDLLLDGSAVLRINSAGVRSWELFTQSLGEDQRHVRFIQCAPALVTASALVHGLLSQENTISVQAPYVCTRCQKETRKTFQVETLLHEKFEEFETACKHCGKLAEFDELPGDYFAFLRKS
jgi:hypothetical protein